MSKKIMGITVSTPISISKIDEELKPVKTVNNVAPDENGNVEIKIPKGANGKTPYIQDGYWYIDGVNTNVKAEGKDGVGISKVEKTATSGKVDTYTITFTNNTTFAFTITNGEDGNDGVGISSIVKAASNGLVDTYTITLTDKRTVTFTVTNGEKGTSVTVVSVTESKASGGSNVVAFSDGNTLTIKNGKDGNDYILTEADKTEIAAKVVEMLGGSPVFGIVDENNNIIVSGNLADGTYTLKYEHTDGTYSEVGTVVVGASEEEIVNLISTALDPNLKDIYNGVGFKLNTRYSFSSNKETTGTNLVFTGLIPFGNWGDVFRIGDLSVTYVDDGGHIGQVLFYQQDGTLITNTFEIIGNYATISTDDNGHTQFVFDGHGKAIPTNTYYFRVAMSPATDNPIMTRNQPITE